MRARRPTLEPKTRPVRRIGPNILGGPEPSELPTIQPPPSAIKCFFSFARGPRFRGEDPPESPPTAAAVLTTGTQPYALNPRAALRLQFWVCGVFEVHDGRSRLWARLTSIFFFLPRTWFKGHPAAGSRGSAVPAAWRTSFLSRCPKRLYYPTALFSSSHPAYLLSRARYLARFRDWVRNYRSWPAKVRCEPCPELCLNGVARSGGAGCFCARFCGADPHDNSRSTLSHDALARPHSVVYFSHGSPEPGVVRVHMLQVTALNHGSGSTSNVASTGRPHFTRRTIEPLSVFAQDSRPATARTSELSTGRGADARWGSRRVRPKSLPENRRPSHNYRWHRPARHDTRWAGGLEGDHSGCPRSTVRPDLQPIAAGWGGGACG